MKKKSNPGTTANPAPAAAPSAAAPDQTTAEPGAGDAALVSQESLEVALKSALEELTGSAPKAEDEPEAEEAQVEPAESQTEEPEDDDEAEEPDEEPAAAEESTAEEPKPETADEDQEAVEEPKSKRWPKSYLKRITKLTDRIAQLEERLATDQPAAAESPPDTAVPLSVEPADVVSAPEEKQLRDAIAKREEFVRTLGGYLKAIEEGETPTDPAGKPVTWTAEQMKDARERFTDELTDLKVDLRVARAEARRTQAQSAARLAQALAARHPWTQDRTNPDTQTIESVLQRYPILKQIPEARTWLADGLSFQRLLERAAKRTGNGQPARKPGKVPTQPTAAPRAVPAREAEQQVRNKRFLETGSFEDGRALIENLL